MKTMITSVILAATLSVFLSVQAKAAPFDSKIGGVLIERDKVNKDAGKVTNVPAGQFQMLGGLEVKSFTARRDGNKIALNGVVTNTSLKTLPFSFKMWKWTGGSWTMIQEGGTRMISSKESMNVPLQLPATNDALSFKLQISGGNHQQPVVKQCKLAARPVNFVVRYGTSGNWLLIREYHNDLSDGFDASELSRTKLRPLGFQTQIKKKKTTGLDGPFSITTRIYTGLSIHTDAQIERAFDTRDEAEQFRQTLISLTKDTRLTVESVREQGL